MLVSASAAGTQPDLALWETCAPALPFAGTVTVRHEPRAKGGRPLAAMVGGSLLWTWRRRTSAPDVLLDVRSVLRIASTMTDPTIPEAVGLIGSHLGSIYDLTDQGIARMLAEMERLCAYLELNGINALDGATPQLVLDFVEQAVTTRAGGWRDPSVSTMHTRRSSVNLLYRAGRILDLTRSDPARDIVLPPRSALSTRPLTNEEELLGRLVAPHTLTEIHRPVAWALGQATATTTEQSRICRRDLDLDNGRVWIDGGRKRTHRWGYLTSWGQEVVERALRAAR